MGQDPIKLAFAVHKQLGQLKGEIPVVDIALSLDIQSIQIEELNGCEGALITPTNKSQGKIVVDIKSSLKRKRFTIAHELGHFLNDGHRPQIDNGGSSFMCDKTAMRMRERTFGKPLTKYQRQELEANLFAADLLMPIYKLRPYLKRTPNLQHVLDIGKSLNVSREAAANRYVKTHDHPIAIVFSRDNVIRYISKDDDFPRPFVRNGQSLPHLVRNALEGLSDIEEQPSEIWLKNPTSPEVLVQTLGQRAGYQMTLLISPELDEDDDVGIESSYERFSRFN